MIEQMKEYFRDRGVTASNLPKVIITHEFLSVAFLALTWAACYQIQPSQSTLFAPVNNAIRDSNNGFVVRTRQSFDALLVNAERRASHQWLTKRGLDSGRVAVSLAESTIFRKLAKPITIPGKLWLTLKIVQGLGGTNKGGTDSSSSGSGNDVRDSARSTTKERRRRQSSPTEAALGGKGARAKGDSIVNEVEVARLESGSTQKGGANGVRGAGGRWGGRSGGRRRKAICPPGERGGAPGCFVPTSGHASSPLGMRPGRVFGKASLWQQG